MNGTSICMDKKEKDAKLVNAVKVFQYVIVFQVCSCYCLRCFLFSGEKSSSLFA